MNTEIIFLRLYYLWHKCGIVINEVMKLWLDRWTIYDLGKELDFFFRGYTKKHLYYQFQALYTLNHLINHKRKLYLFICINADGNGFIAERYWRSLLSLFSQYHFYISYIMHFPDEASLYEYVGKIKSQAKNHMLSLRYLSWYNCFKVFWSIHN